MHVYVHSHTHIHTLMNTHIPKHAYIEESHNNTKLEAIINNKEPVN